MKTRRSLSSLFVLALSFLLLSSCGLLMQNKVLHNKPVILPFTISKGIQGTGAGSVLAQGPHSKISATALSGGGVAFTSPSTRAKASVSMTANSFQ